MPLHTLSADNLSDKDEAANEVADRSTLRREDQARVNLAFRMQSKKVGIVSDDDSTIRTCSTQEVNVVRPQKPGWVAQTT